MRWSVVTLVIGALAFSSAARAQSAPPSAGKGYVEGIAQSAFGNATSQSYGGELGVTIWPGVQAFVEAGDVRNAAPSALAVSAAQIASASQTQFTAKEPLTFGLAGVRVLVGVVGRVQPYLVGGGGVARLKKEVGFTSGGVDVTGSLAQPPFNTVLGSDLSGSETSAMLTVGGGVVWTAWPHLVIDLQYRYGRVLAADGGINVNRAGVGLGVRF